MIATLSVSTRHANTIRTAGFMQTIVDAIRSLQVIYEHKMILPFRRTG